MLMFSRQHHTGFTPLPHPVLVYICSQTLCVTNLKTPTLIYEVSFPLEETVGDKVLPF